MHRAGCACRVSLCDYNDLCAFTGSFYCATGPESSQSYFLYSPTMQGLIEASYTFENEGFLTLRQYVP